MSNRHPVRMGFRPDMTPEQARAAAHFNEMQRQEEDRLFEARLELFREQQSAGKVLLFLIVVTIFLIAVTVLAGCGDSYSVVMNCKPPLFRRVKEAVVRREGDGTLFYRDYAGHLVPIAPGADLASVCRAL